MAIFIFSTTVYTVCSHFEATAIDRATHVLQKGGVVVYPTDTLYGLGADATNPEAVTKVRAIKGRESEKPILAMVADVAMLEEYAIMTPLACELVKRFLPGPLTLVLEARTRALTPIIASDGSVGFRIPDHSVCRTLVSEFGAPITSTSMNRAGKEPLRDPAEILTHFSERVALIDLVLSSGAVLSSTPSTIVDARGTRPIVFRQGAVEVNMCM